MRRPIRTLATFSGLAALVLGAGFAVGGVATGSVACDNGTAPTRRAALWGPNHGTYCWVCAALGRTFGRDEAVTATETALARTAQTHDARFLIGELGWPWGGSFYPHRTHKDGLAVDVMVPLKRGVLPTHALNRFGYDEGFDAQGAGPAGEIDFAALGQFIANAAAAAREQGGHLRRVILAPDLQDDLAQHPEGRAAFQATSFSTRPSWVRHDDHVHLDFSFPCPG